MKDILMKSMRKCTVFATMFVVISTIHNPVAHSQGSRSDELLLVCNGTGALTGTSLVQTTETLIIDLSKGRTGMIGFNNDQSIWPTTITNSSIMFNDGSGSGSIDRITGQYVYNSRDSWFRGQCRPGSRSF